MWPYFPELLERAVPRYTSYPTAADFHDGIGSTDMASALDAIAAGTLVSLYVHIPYCDKICWYCGCNTNAAGRSDRISTYLTALRHEVTAIAERLRNKAVISQIAFGGGSPNVLSLPDFQSLAQHVRSRGAHRVEIPRELHATSLAASAGVHLGFDHPQLAA